MADEDLPIDLQTYRRLVTDFEREYDEIDCWFRQTRDGNFPVRTQALKIAEQGRKIVALDQQLLDVWQMLNHVVSDCEQQIPLLEAEAKEVNNSIEKERSREKELTADYDKEKDSLNQDLGGKKSKLKEIAQARKDFDAMGIKDKLALAAREDSIKQEIANKQMLLDDLLKTHASIEENIILQEQSFIMRLWHLIMLRTRLCFRSMLHYRKNVIAMRMSVLKVEITSWRNTEFGCMSQMNVFRFFCTNSIERIMH